MFRATSEPRPDAHELGSRTAIHIIRFPELRAAEVEIVSDDVLQFVRKRKPMTLLLDFAEVKLLTGAALGKLVAFHTWLRDSGKRLVLTNLSARLAEVFEVTGLDTLLDIRRARPWGKAPFRIQF
jgi:anti-anti-sigma factor